VSLSNIIMGLGSIVAGLKAFDDGLKETRKAARQLGQLKIETHEVHSIEERLRYVLKMIKKGRADPRMRKLAVTIVSKKCGDGWCTAEKDPLAELKAIFDYVRENVRYVKDPVDKDLFQHPFRTLQFHAGDCDCYTILIACLVQQIGYPVRMRVVRTKDSQDWNHIYLTTGIKVGNKMVWKALDASVNKPAFWDPVTAPETRHLIVAKRDFNVP
jgi:transglutaminase-like putative cysteine protease